MSRTWFITGVSSGFGLLMATKLLERGDTVAGTSRKPEAAAALKSRFPERFWSADLDLTDGDNIERTIVRAFDELGKIDVIVSNAGYGLFGALEGLSAAQIDDQIAANLVGPIRLTKAVAPFLRRQGGGRIIAISTYGGQATHAGASLYHASKWGLEGFMETMSQELAAFNIGVTIVEPGGARTGFRDAARTNLGARLDAYQGTPAGMVHDILSDPSRLPIGDPEKMVNLMLASVDIDPAPRRLVLGSDAYKAISAALSFRSAEVDAQKDTASLSDLSG